MRVGLLAWIRLWFFGVHERGPGRGVFGTMGMVMEIGEIPLVCVVCHRRVNIIKMNIRYINFSSPLSPGRSFWISRETLLYHDPQELSAGELFIPSGLRGRKHDRHRNVNVSKNGGAKGDASELFLLSYLESGESRLVQVIPTAQPLRRAQGGGSNRILGERLQGMQSAATQ